MLLALRSLGVEEWAVGNVQVMYCIARSRVPENGQKCKKNKTVVGLHQGVLLSPLLFLVLEALSKQINHRKGVSWELRYADELVTLADTLDDCITRLRILDRRVKTYEST